MVTICETCGIQISEDEGNLQEHVTLGHDQLIFKPVEGISTQLESDLYDAMP